MTLHSKRLNLATLQLGSIQLSPCAADTATPAIYPRLPMVHPDFTFEEFLTVIGCALKGYQVWFNTAQLKGKDILLTKEVWQEAKLCMASGQSVLVEIKGEH